MSSLMQPWFTLAPTLAKVDIGGIIYMIAIIFWVVSRLAASKKKRAAPPQEIPSPQAAPRPVDAELKELFETITGQKLEPIRPTPAPPPQAATPPPAPRPRQATSAPPSATAPARPRRLHPSLQPKPRAAAPPPLPAPTPSPRRDAAPVFGSESAESAEAAVADLRGGPVTVTVPAISFAHHSASGHAMTMKLPALRMGFGGASLGSSAHLLAALREPQGLRAAMTQRVVLGPPRALEPA